MPQWYRDRLGRRRDAATRRYWRLVHGDVPARPEDEVAPPGAADDVAAAAAAERGVWEPEPPPSPRQPLGDDAGAGAGGCEWSPEPEPEPEPEPAIPTAEMLAHLGVGQMWAAAVRWMADPRRTCEPAPIRPGEAEMYVAAWAAVIDRYMPDMSVGPIGQLAAVTAMGVLAARAGRAPRAESVDAAPGDEAPSVVEAAVAVVSVP